MGNMERKLEKFLNLFWLRPEKALLGAFKSKAFEDIPFESPSLDISCGDGLFMFLHLGGTLGFDFDYFQSTRAREFKHNAFIDIYDHYSDTYEVPVERKASTIIDYGTDWKQALLAKASKLNLYRRLVQHDNNYVPLPIPDNECQTIYSNSVYWVKNTEALLRDIHRMLKPSGTAILEVLTPSMLGTLDEVSKYLSEEAIAILDRKRCETMPGGHTYPEWKRMMLKCGFTVEETRNVYPHKLLLDIWNIGLRPISHLLIAMSEALSIEERRRIKREWVEIFLELFKPLLSLPETYSLDTAPYLLFVMKK